MAQKGEMGGVDASSSPPRWCSQQLYWLPDTGLRRESAPFAGRKKRRKKGGKMRDCQNDKEDRISE